MFHLHRSQGWTELPLTRWLLRLRHRLAIGLVLKVRPSPALPTRLVLSPKLLLFCGTLCVALASNVLRFSLTQGSAICVAALSQGAFASAVEQWAVVVQQVQGMVLHFGEGGLTAFRALLAEDCTTSDVWAALAPPASGEDQTHQQHQQNQQQGPHAWRKPADGTVCCFFSPLLA